MFLGLLRRFERRHCPYSSSKGTSTQVRVWYHSYDLSDSLCVSLWFHTMQVLPKTDNALPLAPVSSAESQEFLSFLKQDGAQGLVSLLTSFHPPRKASHLSPQSYYLFLSELAHNSPVCSLLQVSIHINLHYNY